MNKLTQQVRAALMGTAGDYIGDKLIADEFNVDVRNVTAALQDAVDTGVLRRIRDPFGQMAYALPLSQGATTEAPAAPAAASKRKPKTAAKLPPLDLDKVRLTLMPLVNAKIKPPQESKWGPLFHKVASTPIVGNDLPTVTLPPEYGRAISSALRQWTLKSKPKAKLRCAVGSVACVIQRTE